MYIYVAIRHDWSADQGEGEWEKTEPIGAFTNYDLATREIDTLNKEYSRYSNEVIGAKFSLTKFYANSPL